jgi:hypothetical protein
MVEEFELPLRLAGGRDFWRGTTLEMTMQLAMTSFASSPNLWLCSILLNAMFVC